MTKRKTTQSADDAVSGSSPAPAPAPADAATATAAADEKKESAAARLARVKQRLAVSEPLAPVRAEALPIELLSIPGIDLIRPAQTVGMARSFELVAMMHPPSVAAPTSAVLAANPEAPYRVIAGRRRVLAAARNGEPLVFCHIYEGLSSAQEALLTLAENNTRTAAWVRDLECAAELINGHAQLTEDDLAFLLGRPVTTVRELVKIARLPESLLAQICAGQITQATAKRLTRLSARARDRLSEKAAAGETITADDARDALTSQYDSMADLFPAAAAEDADAQTQTQQPEEDIVIPDARALFEQLRALSTDTLRSSRVRALAGALCAELEER